MNLCSGFRGLMCVNHEIIHGLFCPVLLRIPMHSVNPQIPEFKYLHFNKSKCFCFHALLNLQCFPLIMFHKGYLPSPCVMHMSCSFTSTCWIRQYCFLPPSRAKKHKWQFLITSCPVCLPLFPESRRWFTH